MPAPRGPVRWLHLLGLGRPEPEESVRLEVEHHLSEATDRLVGEGWELEEARREAERRFGDERRYRPRMTRAERRMMTMERWDRWLASARQVLVGVTRTARSSPTFAAGVVLTMGLGLGANATMYGIVDRLLLRPPEHIAEPDRVWRVMATRPALFTGEMRPWASHAYPDFEDLEAHSGMRVAAFDRGGEVTVGSGEGASRARSALATAELFPLLGVRPRLGRFFTPEESSIEAPLTAVLSEEYWRSAYGADPDVVGRSIEMDGRGVPIVGVAPTGFTGVDLNPVDIWLPLEASRAANDNVGCITGRNCYGIGVVARLAEGVSTQAAEAEATRLHLNGRSEDIDEGRYSADATIVLTPLIAAAGPDASAESRVATWLGGVSILVLLIACANVANLLLARETTRRRATVVRLALGAGRGRLVGHAMAESMVLALVGGALALAIAGWGGGLVRSTLLPGIAFPDGGVGGPVVVYTLVAALAAGLLAGVGPALTAGRTDLRRGADGTYGSTDARARTRGVLTVAQSALSVVLLVGAGLFVRSLTELRGLDLGLDTDRLLVADFQFDSPSGLAEADVRSEVYGAVMTRLSALPAVESVAGTATPFGVSYAISVRVPERDSMPRLPSGGAYFFAVTPGYFETAGQAITRGRPFDPSDGPDAAPVVVVNETMARVVWPEQNPLGRCLMLGRAETCSTVVGVVEDAVRSGYQDEPYMAYYVSTTQARALGLGDYLGAPNGLFVRSRGAAADALPAVAAVLRSASPRVRWARVETLQDRLDPGARSWTLGATMFTVFGLLALVLAAIGLYGVLAFDVAQRTRELGIRSALGAERGRLLRSVLYRGGRLAVLGVAVGLAVAYVAAPYAQDLLFEVSPRDPGVLAAVALTLLAVGLAASLAPGLRATRIDPVAALKSD